VVRGVNRTELAHEVARALRTGNTPLVRELISSGARLFRADALIAELTEQSRRLEMHALRAAQEEL
jgi:hypothetical protein